MQSIVPLLALVTIIPTVAAFAPSVEPRATTLVDFFDPIPGGGSWLDNAGNGLGEPLNV